MEWTWERVALVVMAAVLLADTVNFWVRIGELEEKVKALARIGRPTREAPPGVAPYRVIPEPGGWPP